MNKKGFFTILTSFFLVISIVIAVLAFISIYSKVFEIKKGTEFSSEILANSDLFREHLLSCHEKTYLSEGKIESNPCVSLSGIRGYEIVQDEFRNCQEKTWVQGRIDPEYGRYIYWVTVEQDDGTSCLAKLFVYQ